MYVRRAGYRFLSRGIEVQTRYASLLAQVKATAKSKCCCSILQRKGHGTKSISVIAKGSWYKINFSAAPNCFTEKSAELIPITVCVPFNLCRGLLEIQPSRQNRHSR